MKGSILLAKEDKMDQWLILGKLFHRESHSAEEGFDSRGKA